MIIGVNGKIGSGKDTVGKIIQYLTSECGNSNSSRHRTYAEFLKRGGGSNLRNFDQHYVSDWEVKKFSGKLKTTASLLTGIPVEKFEDQEFKKSLLGDEWGTIHTNPLNSIPVFEDVRFLHMMSVRELLQKLGTEAMRDGLHENVWVNALFADYRAEESWMHVQLSEKPELVYPNWIITDMRFPNEMEAVKERRGLTIRVIRQTKEQALKLAAVRLGKLNATMQDIINVHPSETALDDAKFDYEIINDGTIEDLIEKVREILINENII
jgi:hypothetical protein